MFGRAHFSTPRRSGGSVRRAAAGAGSRRRPIKAFDERSPAQLAIRVRAAAAGGYRGRRRAGGIPTQSSSQPTAGLPGSGSRHSPPGRFFVLAVPVAALLVAVIDWGRRAWVGAYGRRWRSGVGLVFMHLHSRHGWTGHAGFGLLGSRAMTLSTAPAGAHNIPADATLTLVGEATAFLYPRKMGMLRYRTVFDVDTTSATNVVDAWRRAAASPTSGCWSTRWSWSDSRDVLESPQPPADVRSRHGALRRPADGEHAPAAPGSAPPR